MSSLTKIFVYGTLKKGQPNYEKLVHRNAIFVDSAITVDKWPLIVGTDSNIPFLLYEKNVGKHINGEIYLVDQPTIEFLDEFEGVHQNFYSKKLISVKDKTNGDLHDAYCYVLDDYNKNLLVEDLYLDNYDTNNKFNLIYQKRTDTADRSGVLIQQVKKNK